MATYTPHLVVIAGSNGSGKSTSAPLVLRGALSVTEFVNADVIAKGLSAFAPERVAIAAGRLMLQRLDDLAAARENFAFETTLSSRSFAPWIKKLVERGYQFHLLYFWLTTADMAVARVRERVRSGGHDVPAETIIRRYTRGIRNFFELYAPLATSWRVYNNVSPNGARLIASGGAGKRKRVYRVQDWNAFKAAADEAEEQD